MVHKVRIYEIPQNLRERSALPIAIEEYDVADESAAKDAAVSVWTAKPRTVHRSEVGFDGIQPGARVWVVAV